MAATTLSNEDEPRRLFFILNPVAGHYQAENVNEIFDKVFGEQGIRYDVYQTTGQENLTEIVRAALRENYSAIVAAGGDGTVSRVARGLVHADVPLGILPVGTGNLVARELGIPLDLAEACQLLAEQPGLVRFDAMQVEDQIYLPQVSLGLYAHVIEKTGVEEKRRFGMMAYFWRALQELSGRESWDFSLSVDDQRHRTRASLIMLANIGAIGIGDARWGADIHPDDGVIDVCIVRARTPKDYLIAFWQLILRQPRPAAITYLRAKKEIVVTSGKPVPVRLEDEAVERNHITVKILPGAVKVIVPQQSTLP